MEAIETKSAEEQNHNVTRAAGIVSIAVMGSRILGLARETAIGYYFSAKISADAFYLAFRIPNFLRDLFGEGILSKAFITTFIATEAEDGEEAAWNLTNRIFNLVALVLICIVGLGIVFSPTVVDVLAQHNFDKELDYTEHHGFTSKVELAIYLTQLMFPYLLFVSLAAIAMGLLNSKGKFGIPACASSFFNLSSLIIGIGGYYLFPIKEMHPVTGMAIGVTVGGIAQFLIQVPSMYRIGYRYRPLLSLQNPRVLQVINLIGPAVLGVAAVQVNQLTNTFFITSDSAWLTWISRAYRVVHLPIGIFGVAISTVALPQLAKFAAEGNTQNFRNSLSYALRLLFTVTIPASIGLMMLSEPISRLLFEWGATVPEDTFQTGGLLFVYAFGLCGFSALKIVTDGFYAYKDIRAPVIVSICAVALNIFLNYIFIFQQLFFDPRAVVFSTVLTVTLNSAVLLYLLRRKVGRLGLKSLVPLAYKIAMASVVMGVVCWITNGFIEQDLLGTEGIIQRIVNVFVPIAFSMLALAGMYKVLKVAEFDDILNTFKRRFRN
ncbi:MAG: murein biosynthesis integral membrane protein MurJ [Candidatus Poribacteria bacterium]|nr:murein biosynthesis integral membrane protein MurJ [Candidatus Poribacteria bacterium]